MDQRKIFKALEYLWMVMAILAFVMAVYFIITKDSDSALYFFFVFIIGAVMYLVRRYQRRNQEKFPPFNGNKE